MFNDLMWEVLGQQNRYVFGSEKKT
jgi:hypothetical protein